MKFHLNIMRGLPGSGKSTFVNKTKGLLDIVCSADDFRMKDGKYDYKNIDDAHAKCFRKFLWLVSEFNNDICVFIDNTNLGFWSINPYILGLQAFISREHYTITLHNFTTHVMRCAERNVHGVPLEKILSMNEIYQSQTQQVFERISKAGGQILQY